MGPGRVPVAGSAARRPSGAPGAAQDLDNFGLIRLIGVGLVVYSNGWLLGGGPTPAVWGSQTARIGLDILFTVSGYLVAGSRQRQPSVALFLIRRAMRLFPAFIVCVLATIMVIGPLATTWPLRRYFHNDMTRRYLHNLVFQIQLHLPFTFRDLNWNGAVNPMFWTLQLGAWCWLAVAVLWFVPRRLRLILLGLCGVAGAVVYLVPLATPYAALTQTGRSVRDVSAEIPFFAIGVLLRLLAGDRPGVWRADFALLCFAASWTGATWLNQWNVLVEWVTVPYMAICFGRAALPVMAPLQRRLGDASYGIYLYAFPIQQLVLTRLPHAAHPIVVSALLVVPIGFLSWHVVERPALRWLDRALRQPGLARLTTGWAA